MIKSKNVLLNDIISCIMNKTINDKICEFYSLFSCFSKTLLINESLDF